MIVFFHYIKKFIVLSALWLICPYFANAQKVALVLSGGGVKGSAHVGVLKALEENNIPVDYIAGTSMGAVVASLYAAGNTPEQIEKIITSPEFLHWTKGTVEDKYFFYFKQDHPDASWLDVKFNYDTILNYKLPTNIRKTDQIDFGLMYFLTGAGVAANENFDSLYIPFRCVAADIVDKKAVTMKRGYFPEAVRASLTYPFYFKPIKVDDRLLFDGGMYNNFPADVALEDFNPDYIIGSNVAKNWVTSDIDETNIISQIQNMLTTNTNYSVICENGIMIEPDLPKVKELEYEKAKEMIELGYYAALEKIPEIKKYVSDTINKEQRSNKRNKFLLKKPPLLFDSITIEGVNPLQAEYIRRSIMHSDTVFTVSKLKMEYFRLIADDKIESIYPKAHYNKKTGFYNLTLKVKKEKNFVAQFGGLISSGSITGAYVGLQYKYLGLTASKLSVNFYIGKFYNSAHIKNRFDFPTRVPLSLETSFSISKWDYFKTTIRFLEDIMPSYLVENEINFMTDFSMPAGNKGKFSIGAAIARKRNQYYQHNLFSKTDTADRTNFDFITAHFFYERNYLDRKQYEISGDNLIIDARYVYGGETNVPGSTSLNKMSDYKLRHWAQFKIHYTKYFKVANFYHFGILAEAVITNKPLFFNYTSSLLSAPAFQPTPESKAYFLPEYRANNFAAVGIRNIFNIYKRIHFRLEGYLFQPYQEILSTEKYEAHYGKIFETRSALAYAALVYNSPICPISLSISYYHREYKPLSIMFNIGYIMFNKRALD